MNIYGDLEHERIINYLQQWFEDNEKLPKKINRIFLMHFYYCTYEDIEETKKLLEAHFSIRSKSPHVYFNRDPEDKDSLNTFALAHIFELPGLTPELYKVIVIASKTPDPKMMHFTQDVKNYVMINDSRFSTADVITDNKPLIAVGAIQIIDLEHIGMRHMASLSFSTVRIFLRYLQIACPVLLKGVHLINCPLYVNKMFAIVKPFLSQEVIEKVHFHHNGLDNLYKYIPRDMLPLEYGGKAGRMSALSEDLMNSVREQRDYLMDPDYWLVKKS